MPEKSIDESVLQPLLASDRVELRQLPKTVARTFIGLQQNSKQVLGKDPLYADFLTTFGTRVSQLPTGLVLELWKTFLYHLEVDVKPDLKTTKAKNMLALTDQLMSTFLDYACVVEQALPQRIMDKIVELIVKTHSDISSVVGHLPRVSTSLIELSILLKSCRQIEMSVLTENLKENKKEHKLLKRKLQSLETSNDEGESKTKLNCQDILPGNIKYLPLIIDELHEADVTEGAKLFLENEELLFQSTRIISEDQRLQIALVISALEKTQKSFANKNPSKSFVGALMTDPLSWFQSSGNESKLTSAAEALKELMIAGKATDKGGNHAEIIKLLKVLPLECLRGEFESLVSLITVWMLMVVPKQEHSTSGQLITAFARCLDSTFRTPSILKFVDFSILAPKLSQIEVKLEHAPLLDQILQSLAKITSTYQKTLEGVSKTVSIFRKPLESLADVNDVRMSTVLVESIARNLVNKDTSDEKKALCRTIFDQLCQSFGKGVKKFNSDSSEMKCLILRSFNAVIDSLSQDSSKTDSTKEWLAHAPKFADFCLQMLSGGTDHSAINLAHSSCCKYLSHVWVHHGTIEGIQETFSSDLWTKVVSGSDVVSGSEEGKNLVSKMLLTSDEAVLSKLTQVLLSNTSVAVENGNDLSHLVQLWSMFVSLSLEESTAPFRKNTMMQLMQIIHLKVPIYDQQFFKNFLVPCLNLEAAILETDKPLLHRESEAMCLINSSSVNLEKVLDTCDSLEDFSLVWKSIYRIISSAFHKRSSSIVLSRIPIVIAILRNLLRSLVRASDQTRKVSASELKELTLMAHYIDRICEHIRKLKEDFARVAPYIVADVVDCFQRVTLYTPVKSNLLSAIHKLLDICDKHSVEMLAGILPVGRRDIFKHVINEYRKYFKYSGKV